MNCPHCGTPCEPGTQFCSECGGPLLTSINAGGTYGTNASNGQPSAVPAPPAPSMYPQQSGIPTQPIPVMPGLGDYAASGPAYRTSAMSPIPNAPASSAAGPAPRTTRRKTTVIVAIVAVLCVATLVLSSALLWTTFTSKSNTTSSAQTTNPQSTGSDSSGTSDGDTSDSSNSTDSDSSDSYDSSSSSSSSKKRKKQSADSQDSATKNDSGDSKTHGDSTDSSDSEPPSSTLKPYAKRNFTISVPENFQEVGGTNESPGFTFEGSGVEILAGTTTNPGRSAAEELDELKARAAVDITYELNADPSIYVSYEKDGDIYYIKECVSANSIISVQIRYPKTARDYGDPLTETVPATLQFTE
ncbi:zinc ribbon domain-containing protein [Bifidobacterium scaligerum]|nr:zinc ribbon domain-containing protein [Bifidobacterium scaligerum]